MSPETAPIDSLVHHHLVTGLLQTGKTPTTTELGALLGEPPTLIEESYRRLDATHGLVLHPHRCEPWIVHPFSTSPTHTWVASSQRGWWAPCLWCGLGVAALHGGDVTIHTRIGAEDEPVSIQIRAGRPVDTTLWVHFPEPPRLAWGNVHHFCARLVPFHRPVDAEAWAARHGFSPGEILPVTKLGELASRWYGRHADPNWKKWTGAQAVEIFRACGLVGDFWSLPSTDRTF